jgi:hypothetical protein
MGIVGNGVDVERRRAEVRREQQRRPAVHGDVDDDTIAQGETSQLLEHRLEIGRRQRCPTWHRSLMPV